MATADDHPDSPITLLDYASLSVGLETVPEDAAAVCRELDLDETSGRAEVAKWQAWLLDHPRERKETEAMRERMRARWLRFRQQRSAPPVGIVAFIDGAASVPNAPASPMGVTPSPKEANTSKTPTRRLSLHDFASLTMGLEVHEACRAQVYNSFGLITSRRQRQEELAWVHYLREDATRLAELRALRDHTRSAWLRWTPAEATRVPPARAPLRPYKPPARLRDPSLDEPFDILDALSLRSAAQRPKTRLALAEYARLALLLEESPRRRNAHAATFSLMESELEDELRAWDEALRTSPDERRLFDRIQSELKQQRIPERSSVEPPPPRLSLEQYAELAVAAANGVNAEDLFHRYGLPDVESRAAEDARWRARLSERPAEALRFEDLRASYRTSMVPPAPTNPPPASIAPRPSPAPKGVKLTLTEYAVLCAELDLRAGMEDLIYGKHGLDDESSRRAVHEYWQSRFADDPKERETWFHQVQRVRLNWNRPLR